MLEARILFRPLSDPIERASIELNGYAPDFPTGNFLRGVIDELFEYRRRIALGELRYIDAEPRDMELPV